MSWAAKAELRPNLFSRRSKLACDKLEEDKRRAESSCVLGLTYSGQKESEPIELCKGKGGILLILLIFQASHIPE